MEEHSNKKRRVLAMDAQKKAEQEAHITDCGRTCLKRGCGSCGGGGQWETKS